MLPHASAQPLILALQRLGYALLFPAALLPMAALIFQLGQPGWLDMAALAITGKALFSHMPLIYAVAIAFGLSKKEHAGQGSGPQALAGAVNFLLLRNALELLSPGLYADMICGLLAGISTALINQGLLKISPLARQKHWLGDFYTLLCSVLASLLLAFVLAIFWPLLEDGISILADELLTTPFGAFCYGVLDRLLLPLGLHSVLGSLIGLGENNLLALANGAPRYSEYVAGFYPILMFGLPGACCAIWLHRYRMHQQPQGSLLLSLALTSALVGVTEPIEFMLAFAAPRLFFLHAVLTGSALAICSEMGIKVGSYFSAGLLDLVLCYNSGNGSFWLIPIGILFFVIYVLAFYQLLEWRPNSLLSEPLSDNRQISRYVPPTDPQLLAIEYLKVLGGMDNLLAMQVTTTRLSLRVVDIHLIDHTHLLELGCLSWVELNEQQLVLVIGPQASLIERQIRMLADRQSVPIGNKPNLAAS
ncbi:MAG: PTS transporter subunit EIIC [Aeromonas sp.]